MSDKLPINWNIYSFREIAEVVTGTTPSTNHAEYYGGSFPFVGPAELGENLITKSSKWLSEIGIMQARLLPAETILVCCIGATIGKVGFTGIELATNQQINALICNREIAFPRYVFHYCKTLKSIIRNQGASTTLPLLPKGRFQELKISLPPIDQQKRIAAILDKAEELRSLRRQSIEQLDILGRSIFIEMFGDPIFNQHKWQRTQLVNLCTSPDNIKCGPFGTQLSKDEYKTEGVPLWGIRNVNALFKIPTKEFLELKTANKLIQYSIQSGDIVMTRKGTVGNCAVYPEGYPLGIMHSDLLRLRINYQVCNPIFLSHQLHYSRDVAQQIELISGGAIMPGINVTKLKSLEVLTPPHPLQQEFAQRIEAIEHLKSQHRESLAQLDKLFASLQHRAFRGEL
jgi:type I restriction enzyme, S subunit